jgi:DNA repair photolyase
MKEFRKDIKGRGASSNTPNRFERLRTADEPYEGEEFAATDPDVPEKPLLRTEFLRDSSRTIVAENDSPDIGFRYSINPYRGCEHGCVYCYARPTHEYLGFSAGLDFESKILVKEDAPRLLRAKLMSRAWKGDLIVMSGNTDCYQPKERELKLTRSCLEVLLEFRNPVSLITKNALITRDIDLLAPLAELRAASVCLSITSLDNDLCAVLEPRTSRPAARLRAIEELARAGIPVSVNVAPVIPGLNDHEMPAILKAARSAGALSAGYTPVRLPLAVAPLFEEWLEKHRPLRKNKVLANIRDLRGGGGRVNDPQFGSRMRGQGAIAANLRRMFEIYTRKEGLNLAENKVQLTSEHFRRPAPNDAQLSLF